MGGSAPQPVSYYRETAAEMRSIAEGNLAEAARWGVSAFLFEAIARYKEAGDAEGVRVANELCDYVKHPNGGAGGGRDPGLRKILARTRKVSLAVLSPARDLRSLAKPSPRARPLQREFPQASGSSPFLGRVPDHSHRRLAGA